MNARRPLLVILFALLLTPLAVTARAQTAAPAPGTASEKITIHLDPAASQIRWTLPGTVHTVHGTFALKGGLITFDPQTGTAQGEVLVDVTSGQSGSRARDKRMQNEVLESARFPQAIFHPELVTGDLHAGASQNVTVKGTFTLHGSDHPLELTMQVQIAGSDVAATTRFAVPYVAWGMKDPSSVLMHVAKQVDVDVAAKGSIEGLQ